MDRTPPTEAESWEITETVYGFVELFNTEGIEAVADAMDEWLKVSPARPWYLATIAPMIAMGLVSKHVPTEPERFWFMNGQTPLDPHAHAMMQVLVRYLNHDDKTAQDLIEAHFKTHGPGGLVELGAQAVKFAGRVRDYGRNRGAA